MALFTSGPINASEAQALNQMYQMYRDYPSRILVTGPLLQPMQTNGGSQVLTSLQVNLPFWAELTGIQEIPEGTPATSQTQNKYVYSWVKRRQSDAGYWSNANLSGTFNAYQCLADGEVENSVPIGSPVLMQPSNANLGSYEFLWEGNEGGSGTATGTGGSGGSGGSGTGTGDSGTSTGGSGTSTGGSGGSGTGGTTTFEIIDEICPIYGDEEECCGITMAEAEAAFQPLDADLTAIAALPTTAYGRSFLTIADAAAARLYIGAGTGTGTVTSITLTQPAAGITITNSGVALTTSGTRTFALANDLAAVEALSDTGIVRRTGTDAWSAGTLVTLAEQANLAGLSVPGRASSSSGVMAAITSGAAKLALMSNGTNTGIGFRQIDYNDLGDLTGVAVLGRAPNSSGSPAQIASAGNRHFLASDSTNANIGFRAIAGEDLPGSVIKSVNEAFLAANQDVANNSWTTLVSLTLPAGTYLITYLCSWTISYSAGSSVFCEVDLYDGTAQIADTIIPGTFLSSPDTMRGASGTTRKITLASTKTVSVRVRFDGTGVTWSLRRALGSSGGVGTTKITAVEY